MYHMIQEASLLFGQLMVLFFRTPTILDTGALCNAATNPGYQPPSLSTPGCMHITTPMGAHALTWELL